MASDRSENLKLAKDLAKISAWLYDSNQSWPVGYQLDEVKYINEKDIVDDLKVAVATKDGVYYVVVRGSASRENWQANLDYKVTDDGVHHGFKELTKPLHNFLSQKVRFGSKVVLAGHSLGGAIVTLLGASLYEFHRVQAIITFGSPRVMLGDAADTYNKILGPRTFRYVHYRDCVPLIPPYWWGFTHVGEAYWVVRGKIIKNPSIWQYLLNFRYLIWPTRIIREHDVSKYWTT